MNILKKTGFVSLLVIFLTISSTAYAATSSSLGTSSSFGILASTYSNTVTGTLINGDLGYTTGPTVSPTLNGNRHVADSTYNQAGIDQGTALTNLNSQPCTFTFPVGAVDLATDTTHGTEGIYTPGVYCTTASSAALIGTTGITLSGSGTYIFRVNGALATAVNSSVTLTNGASACDLFWTPSAATTLGATSTFAGTDIDASGITVGSTVNWTGNALAFGSTVSTNVDTISVPTCGVPNSDPGGMTPELSGGQSGNISTSGSSPSNTLRIPDTGYGEKLVMANITLTNYCLVAGGFLLIVIGVHRLSKLSK
jgi:hypothetical protein